VLAAGSPSVSGLVFTVAVLATSTVLVAALAWASRRLLGLSVGLLRALVAGLLGFAAAVLLGRALRAAQPGHEVAFLTVALGVPLIVAMIVLVAAEALVPTGTGPGPVEVIQGTRRAIARSRRYSQISRIAVGMAWDLTCAGGGYAARTPPAGGRSSRRHCDMPWRRAG
jgi:ubiquinone biosynthesis protein